MKEQPKIKKKKCNSCGRTLPVGAFYKLRKDRPWRRSKCKICHTIRDIENRKAKELGRR